MKAIDIFSVLRPIIMSVTGVPECILMYQNSPAPEGSYCAIHPISSIDSPTAHIEKKAGIDTQISTIKVNTRANCIIEFYREGALEYAQKLLQAQRRNDVTEALFIAGLGWLDTSAITDLSEEFSGNIEERSQITILLHFTNTSTHEANLIKSVSVAVHTDSGVVQNVEIAVPEGEGLK